MADKTTEDRYEQERLAAVGRRVEAEAKAKAEADAKEAAQAEEKDRTKAAVREALKDDEREKRAKAKAMLSQATAAALIAGGLAFYASLIVQDQKNDE